jgi:molybdate transport system substrate-binding protein
VTASRALVWGVAGAAVLAASGCSGAGAGDGSRLTVLAAASLTGSFEELEVAFEEEHPEVDVTLVLDSSSSLAEQVRQGAPGDVLATADEQTMESVVDAAATDGPVSRFASNRIVLAVPTGPDATVRRVDDLEDAGVRYVVCVPEAPCGRVADAALAEVGVEAPPASEEVDVKAVLNKVELGEADAGLVYLTDVLAAGDAVRGIEISSSPATSTRYAVAVLRDAEEPELAQDWVDLVMSERGQDVLADAGFGSS